MEWIGKLLLLTYTWLIQFLFYLLLSGGSVLYLFLCHSSIEPRWYHSWPKSVWAA